MAKCEVKLPDEFIQKLSQLGEKTDEIIGTVLEEGGKVVESAMYTELSSVIGKDTKEPSKSTGQLLSSLGTSSPGQSKDGTWNVKVGFAENRNDGKTNAMIANILEYGSSKQKARPFQKKARNKSKTPCISAMEEKLSEEVKKI